MASIIALLWVGGEVFAGSEVSLNDLKSGIQKRKETLEKQKAEIEKQTLELEKCNTLVRIPEILEGFCTDKNSPENLKKISAYLSKFTSRFLCTHLGKQNQETANRQENPRPGKDQAAICSICLDVIGLGENTFLMGCGHPYHLECIQPSLGSYLDQERPESLTSCHKKGCDYKISPSELGSLVCDSNQALAIQRMLVRSVDILKFCPNCGEGIAKHNGLLEFASYCQTCERDLCFSCGRPPHHDMTCEELNINEGVKNAFIEEILKTGGSDSYGLCPNCSALIEKLDGCNEMTCGQNAEDKRSIPGSIKGRGCGSHFDWNQRIRLLNAFSEGSSSTSRRVESQNQRVATGPIALDAQIVTALTREEQRLQAGIIRIEADDPRIRDFPEFAALGEMYQIGNFLLSGVAPERMNYEGANEFCRNLDRPQNLFTGNAWAPTTTEWRQIAEAMGGGTITGYNPNLIPGMRNGRFWSSSPLNRNDAFDFYGDSGHVLDAYRVTQNWVRCLRLTTW